MSEARATTGAERRLLVLLGLPSLGLAVAVTTVASLVPILVKDLGGAPVAGALLAIEGGLAMVLPSLVGAWSDGLQTRLGRRLPFVLAAIPLLLIGIVLLPFAGSVVALGGLLLVFYVGYFLLFTPHFALYIDLIPDEIRGRSQGVQNALREVGLALALVGGPALLVFGDAPPFLAAGGVLLLVSVVFVVALARRRDVREPPPADGPPFRDRLRRDLALWRREPRVRRLLIANGLWEVSLNALRTFVVAFFTIGMDRSPTFVSAVLGVVAVTALVAAPTAGWLADRLGEVRLLRWALPLYAAGLLVPAFTQSTWAVIVVPIAGFAAVVVMTLPFSVLMGYLGSEQEGATGAFGLSRGVGLLLGPLLAGVAIGLLDDVFTDTKGYAAVFLVCSAAITASIFLVRGLPEPGAD